MHWTSPNRCPSARVLRKIRQHHAGSYERFVLAHSLRHRNALQQEPLPADVTARFERLAEASFAKQRQIEAADTLPFEAYRQHYLSAHLLRAQ